MTSTLPPHRRARVASVPAGHPYVAAITDPDVVDLLPDPPVAGAPAGQWWPPRLLEPQWVSDRVDEFDLLHLHFGLESHPVATVARALDVVQEAGRPVVFTVHDLDNPHLVDQTPHRRMLDEVVLRADALLTLTDAAARAIADRWGRHAQVIPHPRLHAPAEEPAPWGERMPRGSAAPYGERTTARTLAPSGERMSRRDPASAGERTIRVGLHLRDLRPNVDGVGGVAALADAVARLRRRGTPVVAEIHLNTAVRDADAAERIADLVAGRPGLELHRHPRLDDAALDTAIARLDALVLPYAWGTHSGWAELAWDAAVPVVGTAVGAIPAQHPSDFEAFSLGDPASLVRAIAAAIARPHAHPGPARDAERRRRAVLRTVQARAVREAHRALYQQLVAARVPA